MSAKDSLKKVASAESTRRKDAKKRSLVALNEDLIRFAHPFGAVLKYVQPKGCERFFNAVRTATVIFSAVIFQRFTKRLLLLGVFMLAAPMALGADDPLSISAITLSTNAQGQQEYSVSLQILLIMTALSFIPAFLMLMTSFTRIIIVFSILRQALGLQQTPSNQILVGLALFLTMFIMAPVFDQINKDALQPYLNEQLPAQEAILKAEGPIKNFMLAQTRESDLELFMRLSKRTDIASPDQAPLTILVPAFVTSELKTAFQIGFMIFIPFLIIDLVVSSILMAMGMMMLSPLIISLPFKIMLFVLIDGWALIMGTLAASFGGI